ncbi:hypothetical protein BpHYR1_037029 [Brachionus plicatilis]|uniref:Uncharacterized protein n=1 Tax=Brachionus plicatilis TaxID=10195 RepID=A0A3M7SMC5_BRAPC|nr:hypothetical protein BpHYR1_037029 [Brachionus plicatilis]
MLEVEWLLNALVLEPPFNGTGILVVCVDKSLPTMRRINLPKWQTNALMGFCSWSWRHAHSHYPLHTQLFQSIDNLMLNRVKKSGERDLPSLNECTRVDCVESRAGGCMHAFCAHGKS